MLTPEALVRAWFEEVWNRGDESAIARLMAPDALVYDLPVHGQVMHGPAEFKPYYHALRNTLSEIHVEIRRVVAAGDFAVAHCLVTARHSGQPVEFSGMAMARVSDGQLKEGWNCFDFLTMYQQLGILPALPA